LFISLPFRQLVTGRGAFGWLAVLASVSNVIRCLGLLGFVFFSGFTLSAVLVLFTVSAGAEWLLGAFVVYSRLRVPIDRTPSFSGYSRLIKDSLPQVGLVFLNAGMARLDWILMGLFSTPAHTAEYSFAYRAYEFSPLPLLVLGPFLLNSFSRRYGGAAVTGGVNGEAFQPPSWLDKFVRAGIIFGTFLPLLGVLVWAPLMDGLTLHKYGQSNSLSFLLLSCCIPFQYLINVYWTAEFASNRLGRIFTVTAISAGVVLAGDALLIPYFAGDGAALAWLIAMVVQFFLYTRRPLLPGAFEWNNKLFIGIGIASVAGGLAFVLTSSLLLRLGVATGIYGLLAWVTGLVRREWALSWMRGLPGRLWGSSWRRVWRDRSQGVGHRLRSIDWSLLLFLVGVLDVKLYVKVAAILFAVILYRKKAIPRDIFRKGYLWFYAAMLLLAFLNLLLSLSSLSVPAFFAFSLGCGYWLLSLLAAYYVYLFAQQEDEERIHRTVGLFFLLNSACMLISFLVICFRAGTINPYTYEGEHRRYFINTGDMITGIGLDGSVTTALIGAFGILYFFYRSKPAAFLFCLVTVLLAGSNFVDIMLMVIFLFIFIFRSNRLQKSMILVSMLIVTVFFAKVSPQNGQYVENIVKRIDKRNVYEEPVPIPNAKDKEFVERKEVVKKEVQMKTFEQTLYPPKMEDSFKVSYKNYNRSGRWVSWQQMVRFFDAHPARLLIGAGMGRFSSRLAFKTAALDIAGGYPVGRRYIDPFFRDNYLWLYVYYHSRDEGQHSVVNKPDSVYGQLLCEYGLTGLLLFGLLYAAFFLKGSRSLSYGLPLLLLMGMAFFTEYWFEQLSVVILFELLMLLDRRRHQNTKLTKTPS
jgi:O-antigen/teichoic acid export membrane protein